MRMETLCCHSSATQMTLSHTRKNRLTLLYEKEFWSVDNGLTYFPTETIPLKFDAEYFDSCTRFAETFLADFFCAQTQ